MTTSYPDKLSEIRVRLAAATQEPWACEASDTEVYGLLIGQGSVVFDAMASADINLIIDAPDDLRWAVEEIDHLRHYLAVLGDLAFELDGLRWALENPAPGRMERRRRAFEQALQTLLATPNWREGECHGGCRRYATHEFVTEQGDSVEREACCEECGAVWLATRRAAMVLGWQPAATLRLEPIARQSDEAKGVQG